MLNKAILIGNVGSDPDIRTMPNGGRVANFSLATSEYWVDKNGQRQSRTEWHRIVVYNENLVRRVEKMVHKGSKLYIEGTIKSRKFTSQQDGVERTMYEIVLQGFDHTIKILDPRPRDADNGGFSSDSSSNDDNKSDDDNSVSLDSDDDDSNGGAGVDDEIPF